MADNVQINVGALNRFINRTVQPYLRKRAEEIASEARANAPLGATGDLKNSIVVRQGPNGSVQVKVEAPYAGFVTQGTGPQANPPQAAYYPKLRRRGLIMWSDKRNANPYAVARGIAANGTRPDSYFEDSIVRILGRFEFRWIVRQLEK